MHNRPTRKYGDLTGRVFGFWKVSSRNKRWGWNCICICGQEKVHAAALLVNGGSRSCGCKRKELSSRKRIKPDFHRVKMHLYNLHKGRSRRNCRVPHAFDIPFARFVEMILSPCYYCGEIGSNSFSDPEPQRKRLKFGLVENFRYNGIDRVDNSLDYTVANTVPCCAICNQAKHKLTAEQFTGWLRRVCKHQGWTL